MNASSVTALQPVTADHLDAVDGGIAPFVAGFLVGVAFGVAISYSRPAY